MFRPSLRRWPTGAARVDLAMVVIVAVLLRAAPSGSAWPTTTISLAPASAAAPGAVSARGAGAAGGPSSAAGSVYLPQEDMAGGAQASLRIDGSTTSRAQLSFDLHGVHGAVVGATLRLHATSAGPAGLLVRRTDGSEPAGSSPARPAATAPIARSTPFATGANIVVDVSSLVSDSATLSLEVSSPGAPESFAGLDSADGPRLVLTLSDAGGSSGPISPSLDGPGAGAVATR